MRNALRLVALIALLSLGACQQKTEHASVQATVADAKSAVVIVSDLPLWSLALGVLGSSKEMIPLGEKLALLGPSQKGVQAGRERSFVNVRRGTGSEGWVRADLVVSKAILSVIV